MWKEKHFKDEAGNKFTCLGHFVAYNKAWLFNDSVMMNWIQERGYDVKYFKGAMYKIRGFDKKLWSGAYPEILEFGKKWQNG